MSKQQKEHGEAERLKEFIKRQAPAVAKRLRERFKDKLGEKADDKGK